MVYSPYNWQDNTTVVNATRMNAIEAVLAHCDIKLVTVTHDISVTGDQAITGAGFAPKGYILLATTNAGVGQTSIFVHDGTTQNGLISKDTAGAWTSASDSVAYIMVAGGTTFAKAVPKTLDSDGTTITWSKTGSPTGTATLTFLFFR